MNFIFIIAKTRTRARLYTHSGREGLESENMKKVTNFGAFISTYNI